MKSSCILQCVSNTSISYRSSVEESHRGLQDGVEEVLVEDCGGTDASIGVEEGSEESEHLPQHS